MARVLGTSSLALSVAALLIVPAIALAQDVNPPDSDGAPAATDAEPSSAGSDEAATERARAAFAQGLACVEQHETACAERAFREALSLRDTPAIRYNLASALFDLGRYPEAARLTASVLADETTPAEVRQSAESLQQQLATQGGTVAITVEGATDGVAVSVDGERIPDTQVASVLVAPGARVVTATRGDEEVAREEVQASAGATAQVTLTVAPSPEQVAESAPPPAEPAPAEPPLLEDWRFWAIAGGAAAVVVAAVIIAVVVVATSGVEAPVQGNYDPGILRWE